MRVKGWSKVMKFTYIQTVKSKPFIIGCIVIFVLIALMMAAVNFLPSLIEDKEKTITVTDENGNAVEEKAVFNIDRVYILDKSGLNPDFSFLKTVYVEYESIGEERLGEIESKVTASEKAEVSAVIEKADDGTFRITMARPKNKEVVSNGDCRPLLAALSSAVSEANLAAHGIDVETLKEASAPVSTKITVDGEETKSELASTLASTGNMVISLVMFLAIYVYAAQTGQAVATEKS